jgi:hypothetical protein
MNCYMYRYIRKGQWTVLVIATSIGTLANNYERVWWLPKAHVYLAGTVDGSGDRHKHTYIKKGLWTDLVITTSICTLARDHLTDLVIVTCTGTLGRDYGWIWWLSQDQVQWEGTMDGSGDCHKHMYIRQGQLADLGDCHLHMYIRKGIYTDLVITTSTCILERDIARIFWLPHAQVH